MKKTTLLISILFLCISPLVLSSTHAQDVIVSVSDNIASPGSENFPITVSLDNPIDKIKGVQFDLCDSYNLLTVTGCEGVDRASSFTTGTAASTVGDTRVELPIYTRCKEMEFGFNLASTSNTFPKIVGIILEYDNLSEEKQE